MTRKKETLPSLSIIPPCRLATSCIYPEVPVPVVLGLLLTKAALLLVVLLLLLLLLSKASSPPASRALFINLLLGGGGPSTDLVFHASTKKKPPAVVDAVPKPPSFRLCARPQLRHWTLQTHKAFFRPDRFLPRPRLLAVHLEN